MGSFLSTIFSSNTSSQVKLNKIVDYCEREIPALKNIATMVKNSTSLESTRILYLKSLEYLKCSNSNSQLLKSEIYNLYQDLIIDKAVEILDKLKEWEIPARSSNKPEEENDRIQLEALEARIADLSTNVAELSKITEHYTRKDNQAKDILDIIKFLQNNANEQLKVVSEDNLLT